MAPHTEKTLLVSLPESARLLGLPPKSVNFLVRTGRLKARMVGGKLFIPREDIYRFARCEDLQEPIDQALLDRVSEVVRKLELKAGSPS
jgi:Helix-turn-helix domain